MKRHERYPVIFCALTLVLFFPAPCLYADDDLVISGKLNSESQFVADDGQNFVFVADNEMGEKLMECKGKRVEVRRTIQEIVGRKIITVPRYRDLE